MYERLTDRARDVIRLARREARKLNHRRVGLEHLLLGLLKEQRGVAANVLKNLAVDLRNGRREVERLIRPGADGEPVAKSRVPLGPEAKRVIEHAANEARGFNHNYIGTEHLLLGLLREQDGVAFDVLRELHLTREGVRREVAGILGDTLQSKTPVHALVDFAKYVLGTPNHLDMREDVVALRDYLNEWLARQDRNSPPDTPTVISDGGK